MNSAHVSTPTAASPGSNSCAWSINRHQSPRTPRMQRLRRHKGKPERRGGSPMAFFNAGIGGEPQKPVDRPLMQAPQPHSTKLNGPFATFRIPPVRCFHPRVCLIPTQVSFSPCAGSFPFSSSSSEEEEEREALAAGKSSSTGPKNCIKVFPRVRWVQTPQCVEASREKVQCRQGLMKVGRQVRQVVRDMPLPPLEQAPFGGPHA